MSYTIAIDLDDTLSNTMHAFMSLYNRNVGGKHLKREEVTHYHMQQIAGVLLTDAQQAQMAYELYTNHPDLVHPREESFELLKKRHEQGHRLYVVTGRALLFEQATRDRIDRYYPGIFEDVLMCNYFFNQPVEGPVVSKAEHCQRIGANIMIDDDPDYATNTATHNIKTFLMDMPRNQELDTNKYPSMKRVSSREQIAI